jgi:hypothetical protein
VERPWSCLKLMLGLMFRRPGIHFIVKDINHLPTHLTALFLLAPLVAGCSGASDLLSKDAEWFSRPGRLFIKNVSIETPPLTPDKPVTAEDLVSAEGACPGVGSSGGPADANAKANALPDGAVGAPSVTGTVALGHTECDVVRGIGAPESVNLSSNQRGDRVAVVTWSRGARAGIYTFTAGRLTSIEGTPAAPSSPRTAKPKKKSSAT